MLAVQTDSITKIYSSFFSRRKTVTALRDFSLNVNEGEIFGLLGPNGAGKTTLIKILLGITYPTEGTATILENDISNHKIRARIGYLPENHKYPSYMTGEQVLKFFGKLCGLEDNSQLKKNINHYLELVGMAKWRNIKINKYSKGMMQRLGLAQALLNDPDLIFLDEPTDGVDPIGRKEIREILIDLKSKGKTIFLNSHLLSEVEMITDRVAILNKGVLVKEGTVDELTKVGSEYQFTLDWEVDENKLAPIRSLIPNIAQKFSVKVKDKNELNLIIDRLRQAGIIIDSIVPMKYSLEDMFINIIQESNKEFKN